MALMMQSFILLLLPAAFLLPPRASAGEIIGGQEAQPHSRPYMAYLHIKQGEKFIRCGGFLVSENFVLTAAHCNGGKIIIKLGAHNIKQREKSQQVISASDRIPHPEYNDKTLNNDIMLLKLEQRVKLNKWVETIALPHINEKVKPLTICSVAGWGWTRPHDDKSISDTLQEVDVKVLEDDACVKNPHRSYHHYNISTMLCGGDPKNGKDSALGDSGGPLVCGRTAQGIVSWGYSKPPGVYTKVSTFIPWIQEMMRKLHP